MRFIARHDRKGRYRFAPLQGPTARRLLAEHGLAGGPMDTMVLVEDGRVHVRSDAALRIGRGLRWPWSWLAALGFLVPRPLRDAAYRWVARNRHRLAGDACGVPTPEMRARMLE